MFHQLLLFYIFLYINIWHSKFIQSSHFSVSLLQFESASMIWTYTEPEFRLCWMKLCSSDSHCTTAPHISVSISIYLFIYLSIYLSIYTYIYIHKYIYIYIHIYLPPYLLACLPAASLPTYLPTYLPTHLPNLST